MILKLWKRLFSERLLRQLGLPQTGVAPAVNGSLIVHCYNVVKAGSDLRDLRLLNLLGNIGDIDHTGNLGFTPNINITVHIYTGGEIGADRNIGDALILQALRDSPSWNILGIH